MRRSKTEADMLEAAGDAEGAKEVRRRMAEQNKALRAYCEENGLKMRSDRVRTYGAVAPKKTLDKSAGSGIIEIERAMAAKTFDKAAEYAKKKLGVSISSISELPLETVNAVNNSIGKLYKDIPSLSGIIDEVVVDDINEIAKSAFGWVDGSPRIRLKLSRSYFANMSVVEIEEAVSNLANAGVFTPKTGFYGIFQHEAVHLAEFQQTIKRYGGYEEAIKQSLDRFELAKEIKELALRNCSLDDTSITANSMLCSYAEYNAAEFLAEGYSSTNSNQLTDEIKRLLRKKWGM